MSEIPFSRGRFELFADRAKHHLAAAGAKAVEPREMKRIIHECYFEYYPPWGYIPALPPTPRRGRTPNRRLDPVVDHLVDYWERKLGPGSFTAEWSKGSRLPLTEATAFICDVVEFIDPDCLHEVPKTIERVRAERKRRATSPISKI
jgi:hypothetical protein